MWRTAAGRTGYRGWLAIHAPQTVDILSAEIAAAYGIPGDLPRGALVGVARLTGTHRCRPRRLCSAWAEPGACHWQLTCPRPLPEPIPAPGRLGLWPIPDHAAAAIRAACDALTGDMPDEER